MNNYIFRYSSGQFSSAVYKRGWNGNGNKFFTGTGADGCNLYPRAVSVADKEADKTAHKLIQRFCRFLSRPSPYIHRAR